MGEISISALLIRFLLGGAAVVLCTIVSKKMGTKIGGIFAAFPAVYLAALLTVGLDFSGDQLVPSLFYYLKALLSEWRSILQLPLLQDIYYQTRWKTWFNQCYGILVGFICTCCSGYRLIFS